VVNTEPEAKIVNPEPCGCCKHGHDFAASELTVRRGEDGRGEIVRRFIAVPGGFEVAS
jgi:hypothetical protein